MSNINNNNSEVNKSKKISIQDAVDQYFKTNNVKIVIGTPCYGGELFLGYFKSMIDLVTNFTKLGINYEIITFGNESLITRARNSIVAMFMAKEENTHLLFIDADITFNWIDIIKLVLVDKEVVGGSYPKKTINWSKVQQNFKNEEFNELTPQNQYKFIAKSVDYVFNPIYIQKDNKIICATENNCVKVKDLGTGFMLIKREVFEIMMHSYKDFKYVNNVAGYYSEEAKDYFYKLFDTKIDEVSGVDLSEDYYFCKKWRELGGECWIELSIALTHTGKMDYNGALALSINQMDHLNMDHQIMKKQMQNKK